jgi:hypothetical protein
MGRSVKAKQAYCLRGEQHAKGMLEHLNLVLANKGFVVKRVIITSVVINEEVANSMQGATIYQF